MAISSVCTKIASGDGGFIYESAKDQLRWNGLSVKDHINTVMSIGNLLYLDDKKFEEVKDKNNFIEVTKEDLLKIYKDYEDGKNINRGNRQGIKAT